MYKILKKIAKWIGYLPLAGRLAIKPTMVSVFGSKGKRKYRKLVNAWMLLVFYIFGHGFQAWMGYFLFSHTSSILLKIVGIVYGAVNILVTYAQVFLFFRVTAHCVKRFKKEWSLKQDLSKTKTAPEPSSKQQALFIGVTLAGQIIFMICYYL